MTLSISYYQVKHTEGFLQLLIALDTAFHFVPGLSWLFGQSLSMLLAGPKTSTPVSTRRAPICGESNALNPLFAL